MKKFLLLPIALLGMIVMSSCGSEPKPSDTIKEMTEAMNDKDWEKVMSYYSMKEDQKKSFAGMLSMKGEKMEEESGKITDVEILEEKIFADGDSAIVKYSTTSEKKGKADPKTTKMVKVDGEWKMVMEGK